MATEPISANRICKQTNTFVFTRDCRRYTSEGKAVYMVASLGIIHDTTENTQKFYGGKQVPMTPKGDGDQL